jgi:hypothetical protein
MMVESGFVDSFKVYGPSWFDTRDDMAYYNVFAAMPSLHFAWSLILGFMLFKQGGRLLRAVGVIYPAATLAGIIFTANHYIMDAVVASVVAVLAYALYETIFNSRAVLAKGRDVGLAFASLLSPQH